jgi:hypothetical protein
VPRDAAFPRAVYRQTWERLAASLPEREACKTIVGLLSLAADARAPGTRACLQTSRLDGAVRCSEREAGCGLRSGTRHCLRRANLRNATAFTYALPKTVARGTALRQSTAFAEEITRPRAMHNVGVDRHAAALRRETYAPAHGSRRNAAAFPRRTTCYTTSPAVLDSIP